MENGELRISPTQDLHDGDAVLILVRPEMMAIHDDQDATIYNQEETPNTISGTIQLRTFLGPLTRFIVQTPDGTTLTADIPSKQASDFYVAQNVVLSFLPKTCQVLPLNKQEDARSGIEAPHA
jgi:hypothetical protein